MVLQPASGLERLVEGLLGNSGGSEGKFPEGGRGISIRNPSDQDLLLGSVFGRTDFFAEFYF